MLILFIICFLLKKNTIKILVFKDLLSLLDYCHEILLMTLVNIIFNIFSFNLLFIEVQNLIGIEDIPEVIVIEDIKMK